MNPERFRQIEELYHAAREGTAEQRAVLLAQSDPDLRRQVELLLSEHSGDEFLDRPAIQNVPELLEDPTVTQLTEGVRLGPYRIESKLGAGGMGEVFRAVDTRLDRAVAVKVTHERFSALFDREARAISSLNHPNICTLHDVGPNYLVMELVEGETIAARLKQGPMPVELVRHYGAQIAAALAEAHAKGIVHRDLKPGNIMLAKSGAKVLDFGLARPFGLDETVTASRMVMGTPAYMAPEQREGKPCDARSDIYSFGCVLYEMSTGIRVGTQRKRIPSRKLERIVDRCLETDPARRWQSAAELERELRVPAARRRTLYAAVALAALAAGALLAWRFAGPHRPVTSPSEYTQLTNFNDSATGPALSPDGRMVTFFRGGEYFLGEGQIYVKMLPDGESKQLTFNSIPKYDPVFTPDASRVAYTSLTASGGFDTWTVPVLGGPPTRLMVNAAGLTWIGPDRILFSEIMAGSILHMGAVTAKESRAEERAIYFPAHERAMAHYSWLSPDRDWVLIVQMNGVGGWDRCRVVPMDGKSSGAQVGPQGACLAAAWSPDGRWMYLNVMAGGSAHLWRQQWVRGAPLRDPEQITFGPAEEEGVAVAPDGKSLVTSVGVRQSTVWTHDAAGDHPVSLEGSARLPWLSPDGKRLYYLLQKSNSSDVSELWRRDLLSGKSDPLLTGQRIVDYDVSRDEAQVAFTVHMRDESLIFLAAADRSSPPRLVVKGGDQVSFGAGQLFFRQLGGKANYPARVQNDGSGLTRILDTNTTEVGGVSPDGEWVTIADIDSVGGEYLVGVRRSVQRKICAGVCFLTWSPDGKYLYLSPSGRFSPSESTQPTYVIPIPHGVERLEVSASAFDLANQDDLAGFHSIPQGSISPGPDPQTYAFTISSFQGNLFRIPLH